MTGYTDEQKQEAIRLLEEASIWAACEAVGAHHTTIYRWYGDHVRTTGEKESSGERRRVLRDHLRDRLLEVSLAMVDRADACENGNHARGYMTAAAIGIDKYRLEMGEHTDRTQHINL